MVLDGDEPLWRIPAERMKMREAHIVPLARQSVDILKSLHPITGRQQYVFPAIGGTASDDAEVGRLFRQTSRERKRLTA